MERVTYTAEEFLELVKLIGQNIFFFIKASLPYAREGQIYAHYPMINPMIGKAQISGVNAQIEKKATTNSIIEIYENVRIEVRNPWYEKPSVPVNPEDAMGWPAPDPNGPEFWYFPPDCLDNWFYLKKEDLLKGIREWLGGKYYISMHK